MNSVAQKFGSLAFVLLFFALWEIGCYAFGVSDLVLPRPSNILYALYLKGPAIWPHAVATLTTTFAGFVAGAAAGVVLGIVIGYSKLVYDALYPTLVGFSSIPKVALAALPVRLAESCHHARFRWGCRLRDRRLEQGYRQYDDDRQLQFRRGRLLRGFCRARNALYRMGAPRIAILM